MTSINAHHHTARLDDGISRLSGGELQFVSRLVGDRGGHDLSPDIDANVRCGRASFHFDDLAFELVARAEFRDVSPFSSGRMQSLAG